MSDSKSSPDWTKDWQAIQQQYWNAWNDLTRSQAGSQTGAAMPWHEGLEQWSRMFSGAGKQSDAVERLMASAKNYLGVMQSMLAFAAGKNALDGGAAPWLDALRSGMNLPGMNLPGMDPAAFANLPGFDPALLNNPVAKAVRDISGQGVRSFQQLAEGAAPMLKQFQAEGLSWLQAPAFGYLREHQEHYQKMALAFAEFQGAVSQYNELMLKASQRSFEILESKLAERAEPGRQVDSMRALYDLWVDAAEEAYAEIALSDEFRKVYGDVVNAQMRVRSQLQQEVERIGVDLGMPTRTELNSVHKRLHDLRRELRNGRGSARSDDRQIAALRGEIDELRRLLENVEPAAKATAAKPAAPKPVARKAAAPKPAAPRGAHRASAAKPAHVAKRAPRPAPKRAVRAPAPEPRRATRVAAPSFGDAIAALRKQAAPANAKKSRAARVALPAQSADASPRAKSRAESRSKP